MNDEKPGGGAMDGLEEGGLVSLLLNISFAGTGDEEINEAEEEEEEEEDDDDDEKGGTGLTTSILKNGYVCCLIHFWHSRLSDFMPPNSVKIALIFSPFPPPECSPLMLPYFM